MLKITAPKPPREGAKRPSRGRPASALDSRRKAANLRLDPGPDVLAAVLRIVALKPCNPANCQVCGCPHDADDPHIMHSVYYHIRFEVVHGRPVTHADAVAHCPIEIRHGVRARLELMGTWTEPARGERWINEPYYDGRTSP